MNNVINFYFINYINIDNYTQKYNNCTVLIVGSDDVASSYDIGVLTRRQVGRREEVGGLVKSPVMKLACSDLQHTRTGGHRVKDEVARCKLRRPND